jgi:hypothetical protein
VCRRYLSSLLLGSDLLGRARYASHHCLQTQIAFKLLQVPVDIPLGSGLLQCGPKGDNINTVWPVRALQ